MEICNCHTDLNALLCDIPFEWREGIVNAICFILQDSEITCDDIKGCQTLTTLSPFTITGNTLSITYKNERGSLQTSTLDLAPLIESSLDDIDPECLMSQEDWDNSTNEERLNAIFAQYCECCPTTTTTTSTTTTTTSAYNYFLADSYTCDGGCILDEENIPVALPASYDNVPGTFFPAISGSEGQFFIIATSSVYDENAIILDTEGSSLDCDSFCPTTTTTTTSTTTTTTIAPDLFWIPFETECESANGFEVDKTITGLSSPIHTWYDTVNSFVYVADQDNANGNVYWFNPVTATVAGDMIHSSTIIESELYNAAIDSTYRKIYFVGRDSGGLLVYDIDTDTTSVVAFGTDGIAFNRIGLTVATNYIYCTIGNASTTTNIVIINRSSLTIAYNHLVSSLPTPAQFTGGTYSLTEVGSEIWVASNNSSFADVGVYSADLLTRHAGIVLPAAATWDFGKYWQGLFWDSAKSKIYAMDIGSSGRHVIDVVSRTVIDSRYENNRGGKSDSQISWAINPITNELVGTFAALNSSVDTAPIKRTYIIDRDTYDYLNMFEGQYYINLMPITGTNTLVGSDPGAPFWIDPINYDIDGSITILSSSIGVDNNGTLIVVTLQELDGNNGNMPTGNYKANLVGDPDYIPPYFNSSNCPIITSFNCPTSGMTTLDSGTLYYEFSIPASVKNNATIDNIAIYAYNIDTVSREGSPVVISDPTLSNYYSGTFVGIVGTNMTIEVVYRDNVDAELENCIIS